MNYEKFKEDTGATGVEMVKCISEKYPGYTKIQQCMVCNPERYGVKLLPDAEHLLKKAFASYTPPKAGTKIKIRRVSARLDRDTYRAFIGLIDKHGYKSVQEALEELIKDNL